MFWQGRSLHFALLCPAVRHIAHTLPRRSWALDKSSSIFCFPCKWLLALCTFTPSNLRYSDSSIALRSKGLWRVWEIGLTGAIGPVLLAAASGKYGWDNSLISSSAVLALGRTFSHFGSRCVDCPLFSPLILFSSASNIRLSASNSFVGYGKNESKSSVCT